MPRAFGCPSAEGMVEPASATLCPVAREYPSRALGELFQPPALTYALWLEPFKKIQVGWWCATRGP
jgi:hypothetical protein